MWDKIAKIGISAGKAYIAHRGVDGAMEDAKKVFGWAKNGVGSVFSSDTDEEIDDHIKIDFDKVQILTDDCITEMNELFREAKLHDITSRKFYENACCALYTGYNVVSQLIEMEDELDDDDFDILMSNYVQQIDGFCDKILLYIGQECKGAMNAPDDVEIGDEAGDICLQVYGVYPVNFDIDMTMLVAVVINGIIEPGCHIKLTDKDNTEAEVAFIRMFGKTLDRGEPGDLCCVALKGNYTDVLPDGGVFQIGLIPKSFQDNNKPNKSSGTLKDSEKEYLEEYKACLEDDGEISAKERRLLNRLRDSLGISEERANALEASCGCNNLSSEEQEYADEVKACLEDDGIITERERRLLDRLAKSLNINPERAREIETLMS